MGWISFFERQPENGQGIWYYGEHIGVWSGEYCYSPKDSFSHHLMLCHESPGIVDRMDAPWWMPDDGVMERPEKPEVPYPSDYPDLTPEEIKAITESLNKNKPKIQAKSLSKDFS